MEQRVSSDKNILRIKTFVFPEVENQRNGSVKVGKDQRYSVSMNKARSVTCSKLNMKIIGKKLENCSELTQLHTRTQTLLLEESFLSLDTDPGVSNNAAVYQYPRLSASATMKNLTSNNCVFFSPEIPKTPIMLNHLSKGKSKFAMVKKYLKVEKNPMKDWIVEETFTSKKTIHLVKPKKNLVSKQRVVRSIENNAKTRKVTAWIPRAIPFLNITDDLKKIEDD